MMTGYFACEPAINDIHIVTLELAPDTRLATGVETLAVIAGYDDKLAL